jgi:hypothetical protein
MKTLIVYTLLGSVILLSGSIASQADTFTVHGCLGTAYGR